MREFFKHLYRKTYLGRLLLNPYIYLRNNLLPKSYTTGIRFRRLLGYDLNLQNPITFNDKLQWLKIHDRTSLHTRCADKFEVRKHVEQKLGTKYLIPLVFQSYEPKDLVPDNFPDYPVIIKANHDSSGGLIVRDKRNIDWDKAQKNFAQRLQKNYYHENGEWQYKNIRPCILVEKLLSDEDGNIPADFKLFCFNGKAAFIQLDLDRETSHKRNMYDLDWNLLDFKYIYENGRDYKRPVSLEKMIELAEIIASDFTFVRVDFYNIGERIYFGEITFHPESGFGKFIPGSWDRTFGDLLKLPVSEPVKSI